MPGQKVGVRFIVPEQIERDWGSVGVRSSVATHRTPRKSGGVRASRKRLRGVIPRGGERRPI
eukprot:2370491-Prymnesium_polylepis.1